MESSIALIFISFHRYLSDKLAHMIHTRNTTKKNPIAGVSTKFGYSFMPSFPFLVGWGLPGAQAAARRRKGTV
jgi:hypothetical protein